MPAKARKSIIDPSIPGVYHCLSRCVRRAFLCGYDRFHNKDYGYRRDWIVERMRLLAGLFAMEVHFFSVMQNHLHLLLRNRPDLVAQWTDEDAMRRACLAFPIKFEKRGVADGQLAHFLQRIGVTPEGLLRAVSQTQERWSANSSAAAPLAELAQAEAGLMRIG